MYPRFHLPPVAGGALLLLAAAAGIASFFSPCSFPLLLSILARAPGVASDKRVAASLSYAAALAVGAAVFLILAGLVIALLGTALFAGVTFTSTTGRLIRAAVGVVLIFFGLVQLNRMPFEFRALEPAVHGAMRRQAAFRHEHPLPGFFLFGFGYVLAGFG